MKLDVNWNMVISIAFYAMLTEIMFRFFGWGYDRIAVWLLIMVYANLCYPRDDKMIRT